MNAANFHVVSVFLLFLGFAFFVIQKNGGLGARFLCNGYRALIYSLLGLALTYITGLFGSYSTKHGWVDFSYANINAIRIAWESSPDDESLYYKFERTVAGLGLVERYMPAEEGSDVAIRANFKAAFAGAVLTWIAGGLIAGQFGGKVAENLKGNIFKVDLGGEKKPFDASYGVTVFTGLLSFVLGIVATFTIWSSDAGADPSHPFYEAVMQVATYSLALSTMAALGTIMEERFALEIGLYIVGFFVLTGP